MPVDVCVCVYACANDESTSWITGLKIKKLDLICESRLRGDGPLKPLCQQNKLASSFSLRSPPFYFGTHTLLVQPFDLIKRDRKPGNLNEECVCASLNLPRSMYSLSPNDTLMDGWSHPPWKLNPSSPSIYLFPFPPLCVCKLVRANLIVIMLLVLVQVAWWKEGRLMMMMMMIKSLMID